LPILKTTFTQQLETMSRNKKYSGIWMDTKNAFIISKENESTIYAITNEIECEDHDGAKYKNERVEHSKEVLEQKNYFKAIAAAITTNDGIYVFGPGKAQEQFKNFLSDYQNFHLIDTKLGTSDKITPPEMIAAVTEHFSGLRL
jgi:hypothetical protein